MEITIRPDAGLPMDCELHQVVSEIQKEELEFSKIPDVIVSRVVAAASATADKSNMKIVGINIKLILTERV